MGHAKLSRKRSERGFSLILVCVCVFVLIGMLGLATDTGRMFFYKSELQTYADAAALTAVARLDGTQAGIQAANALALTGPLGATKPNAYNFNNTIVSNVTTGYSTDFNGTYDSYSTANVTGANNYRFVRVVAAASVPIYFLPVLPGISSQFAQSAYATAGQQPQSTISNGGLVPFAPDAQNPSDTRNFGWTPGREYTLKWGNGNTTTCTGDLGFTPAGSPPSQHGFVDIGEGNSNSNVRAAILYGGYPNASSMPSSLAVGDRLNSVPGNRGSSIFDAMSERAAQDTDNVSTTYAEYVATGTGNGRRIVTAPVAGTWSGNGSNANTPIIGFANFFIGTFYLGSSGPICAYYIGPGNLDGYGSGATDGTKVYSTALYQ